MPADAPVQVASAPPTIRERKIERNDSHSALSGPMLIIAPMTEDFPRVEGDQFMFLSSLHCIDRSLVQCKPYTKI